MSEATIRYNDNVIASVEGGSSVTLATKDKYMADNIIVEAAAPSGGAAGGSIVDTLDSGGGIIREITMVDLSNDTVTSSALMSGITAHDWQGNSVVGTLVMPSYEIWTGGSYGS